MSNNTRQFKDLPIGFPFMSGGPYVKISERMAQPMFQFRYGKLDKRRFKPDDECEQLRKATVTGKDGSRTVLEW